MTLFADVGPGPVIIPVLGCGVIAVLFLAGGIVLGGIWLARRSKNPPQ